MHTVSVTKRIDASFEDVWSVLDDFGGIANYHPNIATSEIVAGPDTGKGATRECVFHDGGRVEEAIVSYASEGGYVVDFVDVGDLPLKENVVSIDADTIDDGTTSVTMTANFTPKFGPVGWVMATVMMKPRFRETFEETLEGLESYVQRRRTVGEQ